MLVHIHQSAKLACDLSYAHPMKRCTKCGEDKTEEQFHFRDKAKGLRIAWCRSCSAQWTKNHYRRNRQAYLDKAERSRKLAYKRNTDYIVSYLRDNPCVDCNESDIVVLEFHHLRDKKFNISDRMNRNFGLLVEEISKCEVLCANCHKRRTARERNFYKFRAGDSRTVENLHGKEE